MLKRNVQKYISKYDDRQCRKSVIPRVSLSLITGAPKSLLLRTYGLASLPFTLYSMNPLAHRPSEG